MSDMETVRARYPNARIGEIKLYGTLGHAVFEGKKFDHMVSDGWWSTEDKAWRSARALLEAKAESPEGSTK